MIRPYYEAGGVTLYHGDAREILPALDSGSIDMILTDPPYGHRHNEDDLFSRHEAALGKGENGPTRPICNDDPEMATDLYRWSVQEAARLLAPGAVAAYCCGGGGGGDMQFARWSLWLDDHLSFKQAIVWDKGPMGMGWHYRRPYELVLVAQKPGAPCRWYDETKRIENVIRHITKIIPGKEEHPTPKPEALMRHFVGLHTKPGDVVLDPFAGGGTTLRAAKDLNRRAIGIEIDERWAEYAAKRLQQEVLLLWS